MILEELIAILGFEERGADSVERFKGRLESARSTAAGVAKTMAGIGTAIAGAAVAATGALFTFVTPVAQEFDALIKQADRLSVSFEALQALGFAAEQSGGSVQGMASSLAQMDRRLAEAARGTGRAKKALEDYGLSATNAAGDIKRADEFLLELAEVFETLSTQQQLDLGRQLGLDEATLTLLQQGRAGIQALTDEARELGLVMSEEAARGAEGFNDQMNRLQRGFRALRQRLALNLMPTMTKWMSRLDEWFMRNQEIIEQRLDEALELTVSGIEAVGNAAMAAGRSVSWLSEQLEKLTGVGAEGQLSMLGVGAVALLAKRHPVLAAIAALLLAIDAIRAYMEGEDSAIGSALDWIETKLQDLGIEFESWGAVAEAAISPVVNDFYRLKSIIEWLIENVLKIPQLFGPPEPSRNLAGGVEPRSLSDDVLSLFGLLGEEAGHSGKTWGEIFAGGLIGIFEEKAKADRRLGAAFEEWMAGAWEDALDWLGGLEIPNPLADLDLRGDFDNALSGVREAVEDFTAWLPSAWTFPDLDLRGDFDNALSGAREAVEDFTAWLPSAWTFPDLAAPFRPILDIWDGIVGKVQSAIDAVRGFNPLGFLGLGSGDADDAVIPSPAEAGRALVEGLLAPFSQLQLPALAGDTSGVIAATTSAPDPLSDLLQPLLRIDAGMQQIGAGIQSFSPGDTINNHTRNVDFDQVNNITINQNVSGDASAAAAGSAAGSAVGQAGRRAADIAAQEPGIDSLPPI